MSFENFNEVIDDIKRRTKAGELPRDVRMLEIEKATEWWFRKTGDMPDPDQLDKLSDLILHEDLTNTDRMKMRNNEYPIISDTQIARRQEGSHTRKTGINPSEVPLAAAHNVGADRVSHRIPTKRERGGKENDTVNKAKSRNSERRMKYNEFIKAQPVQTYNLRD